MADKQWMQGAVKHPGAFTKKAKEHNMTPHQFAVKVMGNKSKYDEGTIRQASLCLTFEKASNKVRAPYKTAAPSVEHMKGFFAK